MSTVDLDSMTKDELLEHAQQLGVSPANKNMSKDELRGAIEQYEADEGEPEVGLEITTTMTKDFLSRPLVNAVPGTSQATDYLGRSVIVGNKDYLARNLVA